MVLKEFEIRTPTKRIAFISALHMVEGEDPKKSKSLCSMSLMRIFFLDLALAPDPERCLKLVL